MEKKSAFIVATAWCGQAGCFRCPIHRSWSENRWNQIHEKKSFSKCSRPEI